VLTARSREECLVKTPIALAMLSPLLVTAGQTRSSSPCVRNANQAARYCATICRIAKRFDLAACVPRDEACVATCKTRVSGCRDTASIEEGTLGCIESFEEARVACIGQFPDASSVAFLACVEAARRDAVTCRADYLRNVRENARHTGICRKRFDACRRACPTTTASINVQQCRVQAADAHTACNERCADDQRAARELCAGRDLACVSGCDGGLQACDDSAESGYSIVACKVAYRQALEACRALGVAALVHRRGEGCGIRVRRSHLRLGRGGVR
jgi:hypothetical protein